MNESKMIYLACPYSHDQFQVREARYHAVTKCAARLIEAGNIVFSPITYSHPMTERHAMDGSMGFWEQMDLFMLRHCDVLMLLQLTGWQESEGVRIELDYAYSRNIPVIYLPPSIF